MKQFNESKKRMSMKRLVVKASMFILCLSGFLIHSYFKIRLFIEQEPITEHANEKLANNNEDGELIKIPALSVCFSGSLFKRKPVIDSTLNNQLRSSLYYAQHKQRLPPNVALLDDLDGTQFDDDDTFAFRRRQMINAANGLKHLPRSANHQLISVDQAFGLMSKPRFSIKCDLIKPTKQRKLTRFTDNPLACEQIAQVIESINYESDQKCFTYFSQLQQNQNVEEDDFQVYRADLNGGDLVQLRIHFDEELLNSKANQAKVHILIHSNVEMPNFQQMKTYSVRSSHNYVVYFNQLAYRRENTNRSPCRQYRDEMKKSLFSQSYLQQVPIILMNYQGKLKNHLYKLLFSQAEQQNVTKVEDRESQVNNGEVETKKEMPKSQSDCIDKCHLETNRKYCICLPGGVNVRRELLSSTDLFCDELRCLQEELPQSTNTLNNNVKNGNLIKNTNSGEQLEQLYSISNGQFVSKRYERFKKCIEENECIASCEEDRYDYSVNEQADLHAIVRTILNDLPTNITRSYKHLKGIASKKLARNYYPDGFYYDPNYNQKSHTTIAATMNKKFAFKQPEMSNRTNQLNSSMKSAVDDLSKNFLKNINTTIQLNDTRLNTSIIVQAPKRNQSSVRTTIMFTNRKTANEQQSDQTIAFSEQSSNQFRTTVKLTSPVTMTDEINSIEPDNVDENDYSGGQEFTQSSSMSKYTVQNRKSFKFASSTSTLASAGKTIENSRPTIDPTSSNNDELEDIPIDETIEERHNPSKSYQTLISFRNNRNANRLYTQRLFYSLIDLVFDLALIAVVWLGFSIYLVADHLIYFVVLIFWYFVRFTFCLDWCFRRTSRKNHRRISASSTTQLTNRSSKGSSKVSVNSEDLERERTFVKSIP